MLQKTGLTLIIAILACSQYRMTQWKQDNQILSGDEVRTWQIALNRYGLSEHYRPGHIYNSQEVLQENRLVKGYHLRSFVTQMLQKIYVNIDPPHPNFYYASLRLLIWKGINSIPEFISRAMFLNSIFYVILLIYLYRISRLLLSQSFLQAVLVLLSYTLMMGHVINLMYIRMYYLAAMSLVIIFYYIVRAITEESFTAELMTVPPSSQKSRIAHFFTSSQISHFLTKLERWQKSSKYPYSIITKTTLRLNSFCTGSPLLYYRATLYIAIVLALYLNYSSHYFSILAALLWGLMLIFHYRKDMKAIWTFVEILVVSVILMAITQPYFLYNLITASHTSTILHGIGSQDSGLWERFVQNLRDSLSAYWSMSDSYFIPHILLLTLIFIYITSISVMLWRKRYQGYQRLRHLPSTHIYVIIVSILLPFIALFLSPVGKVWRVIVAYTPLFALLIPLFLQALPYRWLRNLLFIVITAYLGWTYPQHYTNLQNEISPPQEGRPQDIKLIYVIVRLQGDTYYHQKEYFHRSIVRLISNGYLRPEIQYQFFDTVADVKLGELNSEGYILLGPYIKKDLKVLKDKGLKVEHEYFGNLYRYKIRNSAIPGDKTVSNSPVFAERGP